MIRPTHPALTQQCLRKFSQFPITFCILNKKNVFFRLFMEVAQRIWRRPEPFTNYPHNLCKNFWLQVEQGDYAETRKQSVCHNFLNLHICRIYIGDIPTKYFSPDTSHHCFQRSLCFFFFSFLSFHRYHARPEIIDQP